MQHRVLAPLAVSALCLVGCLRTNAEPNVQGGEGEGDALVGEGEAEGSEGEADAEAEGEAAGEGEPASPPSGEDCDHAIPITSGTFTGETTNADDDIQIETCTAEGSQAPDLVYRVDLAEPSGLRVTASGGFDIVLYLMAEGCTEDDVVADLCEDRFEEDRPEVLRFGQLAAGTYFVVVDGFANREVAEAGAFTLEAEIVPGGLCAPDALEQGRGDDAPVNATPFSLESFDTAAVDIGGRKPEELLLSACTGDDDYFFIGHMGGALDVSATRTSDGPGDLAVRVLAASLDDEDDLVAGDPVDPNAGDAPRGLYLVEVKSEEAGLRGIDYALRVEHGCEGDFADAALLEDDDQTTGGQRVTTNESGERLLCGDDEDALTLMALADVDVALRVVNGAQLVLTPSIEAQRTFEGNDVIITYRAQAFVDVVVRTSLAEASTVAYGFEASFSYPVPDNDTCAGAAPLATNAAPVAGTTVAAENDVRSFCNGDREADAFGIGAGDVLYALSLDAESELHVIAHGATAADEGQNANVALSLFAVPDSATCPADLEDLVLLDRTGAPFSPDGELEAACARFELETRAGPGDYLLVVDGVIDERFNVVSLPFTLEVVAEPID